MPKNYDQHVARMTAQKAADPALGAALRANLLKRKAQVRGRQDEQSQLLPQNGRVNDASADAVTRAQSPSLLQTMEKN